jgi:hypothetical protein
MRRLHVLRSEQSLLHQSIQMPVGRCHGHTAAMRKTDESVRHDFTHVILSHTGRITNSSNYSSAIRYESVCVYVFVFLKVLPPKDGKILKGINGFFRPKEH